MKLLFVCTGNTCRSVIAERLFNRKARADGHSGTARSCGVAADSSFPTPDEVYRALAPLGIERFSHRPQPITPELLDWSDLVLTMTREHKKVVARRFPAAAAKVKTLRGHAGLPGEDVADPIGQSDAAYAECRDRIAEAIEAILERHEHA